MYIYSFAPRKYKKIINSYKVKKHVYKELL